MPALGPAPAAVIVLAAGGSTRMKSKTTKVLHELAGRSIIAHVVGSVQTLTPANLVVVVGDRREQIVPHVAECAPAAIFAVQEKQLGTGHAVATAMQSLAALGELPSGPIVVVNGDSPLIKGETLLALVDVHRKSGAAVTLLTGDVDDPTGYGRILRDESGVVTAIVEEKDATDELRRLTEVNSGVYVFDAEYLAASTDQLANDNAAGEYYLTDLVALAVRNGRPVGAHRTDDDLELEGVNNRIQLARLARKLNDRIVRKWQLAGVTIADPESTWLDVDVTLEADVTLLPNVQLHGATHIAEDAVIGPDSTLRDTEVGAGAHVVRTHALSAVIGPAAHVGPFSYLRPGTVLGAGGKIGGFVETKNAQIGEGAKVPHLSYVGDAEIGEGANIGAGTIFANFDGVNKNHTKIGKHFHGGSNVTYVAPVEVGDGAATGAGTTVREPVPPGALAVSAGPQRNIEGWVAQRQPGTPQAKAAEQALGQVSEQVELPDTPVAEGESADSRR